MANNENKKKLNKMGKNTEASEAEKDLNEEKENPAEDIDTESESGADDTQAEKPDTDDADDVNEALTEGQEEPDKNSVKEEKKLKKKKKDKKDEKIAELEDRVMRQMAEFQNFRNRTEKEKASMYEMGAKSVIEKILPVIDNFERGLQSVPDDEQDTAIATGMQMIYKQLLTELENIGVKPIEAVGQEFNPDLHNAVMQTESDEYESGYVAQELQKGYTYRDNVVRHSMVAVVS